MGNDGYCRCNSHLLAAEDEALLLGRDALLLLDAVLNPAHTVIRLDVDLNLGGQHESKRITAWVSARA